MYRYHILILKDSTNAHITLPFANHWKAGTFEESKCNYRQHKGWLHAFLLLKKCCSIFTDGEKNKWRSCAHCWGCSIPPWQGSNRSDGTAASPSESCTAVPLCGFLLLLFKSFLWELSEPQHWEREPNSLPEAAETCLQLSSNFHFWNAFISKSSYKPGCIGPQITRWKCEKILDRDEASTKPPNLKAA